jgi:hypothetical protein
MKKQLAKRKVLICDELKVAITREVRETLAVTEQKPRPGITAAQVWNIQRNRRTFVIR